MADWLSVKIFIKYENPLQKNGSSSIEPKTTSNARPRVVSTRSRAKELIITTSLQWDKQQNVKSEEKTELRMTKSFVKSC